MITCRPRATRPLCPSFVDCSLIPRSSSDFAKWVSQIRHCWSVTSGPRIPHLCRRPGACTGTLFVALARLPPPPNARRCANAAAINSQLTRTPEHAVAQTSRTCPRAARRRCAPACGCTCRPPPLPPSPHPSAQVAPLADRTLLTVPFTHSRPRSGDLARSRPRHRCRSRHALRGQCPPCRLRQCIPHLPSQLTPHPHSHHLRDRRPPDAATSPDHTHVLISRLGAALLREMGHA